MAYGKNQERYCWNVLKYEDFSKTCVLFKHFLLKYSIERITIGKKTD